MVIDCEICKWNHGKSAEESIEEQCRGDQVKPRMEIDFEIKQKGYSSMDGPDKSYEP